MGMVRNGVKRSWSIINGLVQTGTAKWEVGGGHSKKMARDKKVARAANGAGPLVPVAAAARRVDEGNQGGEGAWGGKVGEREGMKKKNTNMYILVFFLKNMYVHICKDKYVHIFIF